MRLNHKCPILTIGIRSTKQSYRWYGWIHRTILFTVGQYFTDGCLKANKRLLRRLLRECLGWQCKFIVIPNKTQHKSNKCRRRQSAPRHTYNPPTENYARIKSVTYNQSHFRGRFPNPPPILAYPRISDNWNNTFLQRHTNDIHNTHHLPWFRYQVKSRTSEWINHLDLVRHTMRQKIPGRPKVDLMQQRKKSLYS
jgi:hypothetical protein